MVILDEGFDLFQLLPAVSEILGKLKIGLQPEFGLTVSRHNMHMHPWLFT
jgi:hypothetical protein